MAKRPPLGGGPKERGIKAYFLPTQAKPQAEADKAAGPDLEAENEPKRRKTKAEKVPDSNKEEAPARQVAASPPEDQSEEGARSKKRARGMPVVVLVGQQPEKRTRQGIQQDPEDQNISGEHALERDSDNSDPEGSESEPEDANQPPKPVAMGQPQDSQGSCASVVPDVVAAPFACQPPSVYPEQIRVAESLLERMRSHVDPQRYERFAFVVQVPELRTLYNQTIKRLREFLDEYKAKDERFKMECGATDMVYKLTTGKADVKIFQTLERRIRKEPKTLFLVIHDEAHWSCARAPDQGPGSKPQKTGLADYYINHKTLRERDNVLTLFVSATPYSLLTTHSQIPLANEVQWPEDPDSTYYGVTKFAESLSEEKKGRPDQWGSLLGDAHFETKCHARTEDPRSDVLCDEYTEAMRLCNRSDPQSVATTCTQKMVADLISVQADQGRGGRGTMILLRLSPSTDSGKLSAASKIAKQMRQVRDDLGMQAHFAVLLDIECKGPSGTIGLKLQQDSPALVQRMQAIYPEKWKQPEKMITTYADLLDLPCILIVVEKGKMGDTFPASLRHYDLRLRYTSPSTLSRARLEQDLGRGCRRDSKNPDYPVPKIIVSTVCSNALEVKRGRQGLLRLDPDERMKRNKRATEATNAGDAYPRAPDSTEEYRKFWAPRPPNVGKKNLAHFDSRWEEGVHNPRRFVLIGRPQIGKTGAYLHLTYLLWEALGKPEFDIPEESVSDYDDSDGSDADDAPDTHLDLAPFPSEATLVRNAPDWNKTGHRWGRGPPNPGKYGDPACHELYDWFVKQMNRDPPPNAAHLGRGTTKAAKKASPTGTIRTPDNASLGAPGEVSGVPSKRPGARSGTKAKYLARDAHYQGLSGAPAEGDVQKFEFNFGEQDGNGQLQIPTHSLTESFDLTSETVRLKSLKKLDPARHAQFPIFTPSAGRPEIALLNIDEMMDSKVYVQIVAVKANEYSKYRASWPEMIFFVLPPEADDLGVGCSRYYIKKLADLIVPEDFRYCFVMDDSLPYWKGITLPNDPQDLFNQNPGPKPIHKSISLFHLLQHFQQPEFDDLQKLAVIGFYKLNRHAYGPSYKQAHARKHPGGAVILNLDLLTNLGVNYNKYVFALEDMDLNNRIAEKKGVVCKCYRFAQGRKQMRQGGCTALHAVPPSTAASAPAPGLTHIQQLKVALETIAARDETIAAMDETIAARDETIAALSGKGSNH